MKQTKRWLDCYVTYLVSGFLMFAPLSGYTQQSSNSDISVYVSSQDAQGISQASMNLTFLKLMESYVLERTRIKANEYLASIGKSQQQVNLTSQATYLESGPKKVMVIRITDQSGMTNVTVAGLVGAELKRVLCIKATPGSPPISYGPCGEKISEVFGVRL